MCLHYYRYACICAAMHFFFFSKSTGFIYTVLTISVAARVGEVPFSIEGPPKCWSVVTKHTGKWCHGFGKLTTVSSLSLLEQQGERQSLLL